jgi:hypothetical protein
MQKYFSGLVEYNIHLPDSLSGKKSGSRIPMPGLGTSGSTMPKVCFLLAEDGESIFLSVLSLGSFNWRPPVAGLQAEKDAKRGDLL